MPDPTITVVEAPTKTTTCGGARSKVKWGATGNGYIVQHIKIANGRKNCFSGKLLLLEGWTDLEYWECWQVKNSKVTYDVRVDPKWDDCFEIPDQGRTRGSAEIDGEVKFLPNYKLGNEWKKNQVPEAGILRTTTKPPTGWNATGAKPHTLQSTWVCCSREPETGSVTGGPKESDDIPSRVSKAVLEALRLIRRMPIWSEMTPHDRAARASIEEVAREFAELDLRTARAAIQSYVETAGATGSGAGVGELSRVFVLNRYLFDVPTRVPTGTMPIFGGWLGTRLGATAINPLWPWKSSGAGKRLVGSFKGYGGPSYAALAEFDYFRRRFPRKG